MRRPRLVAWTLVALFLLCSCCAVPICSWRLLAVDNGDERTMAAVASVAEAGGRIPRGGRKVWNRRSLGDRSSWLPPSPLWNDRRSTATPPPSWV
ncbi:hypothetical protein EJB05_45959 [Eragrostis curvula]|uniref:Uncharacterized protein n=1 Tax=Eragrostis curvula TaxID=38414 RepID=A0A5J9TNW2_9POAL|nr:hypothetical protein EJB05_57218 [Eragrostis curvula]TVU12321.1 hypothetical protein EJB05_45959 [Eragrostis curvula]